MFVQHKARCRLIEDGLAFEFSLGPLRVSCQCDVPSDENSESDGLVRATVDNSLGIDARVVRVKCRLRKTSILTDMVTFEIVGFEPIRIFCLVNVPSDEKDQSVAYVKVSLCNVNEWVLDSRSPGGRPTNVGTPNERDSTSNLEENKD